MEPIKDPRNLHRCDFCGYGTKSLFIILKHIRQHRRKLEGHPNVFECYNELPETYKCEDCDFASNLKVSFKHHLIQNHEEDHYQFINNVMMRQCEFCDFQTYSTLVLMKHNVACEDSKTVNKWLKCEHCPYKTRRGYCLSNHLKHQHSTKFALFKCDKCSFKSKLKECLRKHKLAKHTDEINSFEGAYEAYLKKRITTVDNVDPEKIIWHPCDQCEYKANQISQLRRHIRSHTEWYCCNKCKFKSKWESVMKRHNKCSHRFKH